MTKPNPGPNPMPVTVQPGISALLALLKADEGFAVDLKQGVIVEIVRRMMPSNMEELYLATIKSEVDKVRRTLLEQIGREGKTLPEVVREEVEATVGFIRNSIYTNPLGKTDHARNRIVEAVQVALVGVVRLAVDDTLGSGKDDEDGTPLQKAIEARVRLMEEDINGKLAQQIEDRVSKRVDAVMEREIQRRVDERLQAIRTAIAA